MNSEKGSFVVYCPLEMIVWGSVAHQTGSGRSELCSTSWKPALGHPHFIRGFGEAAALQLKPSIGPSLSFQAMADNSGTLNLDQTNPRPPNSLKQLLFTIIPAPRRQICCLHVLLGTARVFGTPSFCAREDLMKNRVPHKGRALTKPPLADVFSATSGPTGRSYHPEGINGPNTR